MIYAAGHSILVYQHFPRVVRERFIPFLGNRLSEEFPESAVTAFATPYAVFFLAQQPKHAEVLDRAAQAVQQQWRGRLRCGLPEPVNRPNYRVEKDAADRVSHPKR